LNLYSFVECFINSVGFDFYLRNQIRLNEKEKEILQGENNGRYLSLEYKMEKFHQIIRDDKKQVFCLSDAKQIKEPFLTFFDECKGIRDAAMHYSPNKDAIWLKPTDWAERAEKYSQTVIQVAQIFWNACYPLRNYPFYLRNLDYKECYKGVSSRQTETFETKKATYNKNNIL
jgi:hypothetical protein